ncbi:ribonuclease III [Ruminococcus sp. OM05-10BH]|nr:ribonuclease III [Ruminococcus sp. OM05-10BH]
MEESITMELDSYLCEVFQTEENDIRSYSPLSLAFIGDCVYDLVIKSLIIRKGNRPVNVMQKETSRLVQASAQSAMMRVMQEHLTEEEHAVYRRGRNAKSVSPAKNQSITDYRRATGFEALIGYLYLKKNYRRIVDLIKTGLVGLEEAEEKDERPEE